ncbi:MAG: hypothetical protein HRT44_07880 [Bdellovibrionales bacterium]|nr:hypothetical protein [Bdellovibrionales bacterium]NQZ19158.1 hypothetical protein [Bdellovibrionales bacterium]
MQITSDEVSTFSTILKPRVACTLGIGAATLNGDCFTPLSLQAKVRQINMSNSFGGEPARLIDFSAVPENTPFGGPFGVLGLTDFDFAAASESANSYSDDNIQDSSDSYFNTAVLEVGAVEMKIDLSGNANVGDDFWTIRYMLMPH